MHNTQIDATIYNRVKNLNGDQKKEIIEYLGKIKKPIHSTRRYKSKALKQIRLALSNPI